MPRRPLTAAAVERIKPPASGQRDHFDAGFPGLALRVSYGGARAWVYFYRLQGKQRRMTLGRYPGMTLADARTAWQDARKAVGMGEDPARRRPIEADSFDAVADEWLKRDQARNRSRQEVERILRVDVRPEWAGRQIATIGRRDVLDLIDKIADRGALTAARRLHSHLHRLFRWSVGRGIIESNPVADLPKPGDVVKRDRVLSDVELAAVWKAAGTLGWPFGPALHLLILTAARREEIGALRWSEIVDAKIELTGDRTKNGEPHSIPLSPPAMEIVERLPHVAGSAFVFTTTGKTPVSGWSKAKTLLDRAVADDVGHALPEWRFHDLRRTAATGMQRLAVALQVVESVLGHVSGSRAGIVGVYQRHTFDAETKAALDAWARHVETIISGKPGNVLSLRRAGA